MVKIKKQLVQGIKSYFSGALVYFVGIFLIRNIDYYQKTFNPMTQRALLYFYCGYLVFSPFYYYFFVKESHKSKPYLFLVGIIKSIHGLIGKNHQKSTKEEKVAFLFMLVKFFFLPTMADFFFNNFESFKGAFKNFQFYAFGLNLIFLIDTFIFLFGYAFEFSFLRNIVKSVEPTLFGWLVALICYPPFNSYAGKFVPWGANDHVYFWNSTSTIIIRGILLLLLLIYLSASISLGAKASNLTNRGIVTKFPYSMVRHPAYVSKNIAWWITILPVISIKFAAGMFFWTIIYFFRAITEEKHLRSDGNYKRYCQKVKFRFIPYLV